MRAIPSRDALVIRLLAFLFAFVPLAAFAVDESQLLPVEQAFALTTKVPDRGHVELSWKIADGYYMYRDRVKVTTDTPGVTIGKLDTPGGDEHQDEFFGKVVTFHKAMVATVPITVADAATKQVALKVSSQGCAEAGVCYPPHAVKLTLDLPAGAAAAAPTTSLSGPLVAPAPGVTVSPLTEDKGGVDAAITAESLPLPPEQAFVAEAIASSPAALLVRFTMPKGYYLYRDKTKVQRLDADAGAPAAQAGELQWPKGVMHKDEHFGNVEVYFDLVEVPLPLTRLSADAQTMSLKLMLQGCQENGICYPPMTRKIKVDLPKADAATMAAASAAPAPSAAGGDRFASALAGSGFLKVIALFFVAGLGLAFTPCVFPMIPILSGIIAGAGDDIGARRAFVLSVVYVLASALVFTIAGVVAGLAGQNLQALFQKPWILTAFAAVFVALSLSMFGYYELQLPASWQGKLTELSNQQQGGSLLGVAIMGALSTLIVGPCVAPPLAAAVVYIGQQHDPVLGGAALFALGIGMGAPLIAFGTGITQLPRAGGWMDAVKYVFGVVFLLLAVWMLERFVDARLVMLMLAAIFIGSAVSMHALEPLREGASGMRRTIKAAGLLLLLLGVAELVGALSGAKDYLEPLAGVRGSGGGATAPVEGPAFKRIKSTADLDRELEAAKAANKPAILDFYADWCVSCKEMEKYTFPAASVREALGGFTLLKADVTANDDVDQALMKRFGIIGPPATLFFGKDGAMKENLRLVGFEEAAKFSERLGRAAQ